MSLPRAVSDVDPRVLHWIPGAVALALAGRVAAAWAGRIGFPYDLEWMEGGMLAHAWRVQRGLPLYPDAGPDWLPYVYPPGYTFLLAALGGGNLDYPIGRAISIAGVLAACAALVWAVGKRGGLGLGVTCAGIFLGCYGASGAFYDLVRPDGLAIGLLAWAIAVGLERWRRAPELAGVLLFLAFTVKHHSAAFGLPFVCAYLARGGWREAARFALASMVPALAFTGLVQAWTGGEFLRWLLEVPASHPIVGRRLFPGAPMELARLLLVAVGLAVALVALAGRGIGRRGVALGGVLAAVAGGLAGWMTPPVGIDAAGAGGGVVCAALLAFGLGAWLVQVARRAPDWRIVFAGALALITCLVAAVMRGHNGGFLNVYIPLHWVVAAGFGFAVTELARLRPGWATSGALAALGALQVGWQLRDLDTGRLIPTAADVAAGDEVVAALREHCHGEILSPYAAWLPVQAGRAPSGHLIALWDIQHAGGPYRAGLGRIAAASRAHRWACVVEGGNPKIGVGTAENYRPLLRFSLPGRALQPKTGWRVRPNGILVPKETPP